MSKFIFFVGIIYSSLFAFADTQIQKLECFRLEPSCSSEAFFTSTSDSISYEGVSDDGTVKILTALQRSSQSSSTMSITLIDLPSGLADSKSFSIHDNGGLFGGVEGFKASNGKTYSIDCTGSRFAPGSDMSSSPVCRNN